MDIIKEQRKIQRYTGKRISSVWVATIGTVVFFAALAAVGIIEDITLPVIF